MRVEVSPRLELSSWQEQEYWRQRYARDDMTTTRAHAAAGRRSTSFHVLPILRAQPDLKSETREALALPLMAASSRPTSDRSSDGGSTMRRSTSLPSHDRRSSTFTGDTVRSSRTIHMRRGTSDAALPAILQRKTAHGSGSSSSRQPASAAAPYCELSSPSTSNASLCSAPSLASIGARSSATSLTSSFDAALGCRRSPGALAGGFFTERPAGKDAWNRRSHRTSLQ